MWEWRTRITIIFFVLVVLSIPKASQAALDHVLITEVQITGGTGATDHDFVEFFNPTSQPIDLNGYRLVKRTANGTTDTTLKSWTTSAVIPANGYFLWANSAFQKDGVVPDETNSGTLSDNNSVALRLGEANTGTIIDSLGWGSATGVFIQGSVFAANPGAKQSLERTAGSDTKDNAQDFFLQGSPNPRSTNNTHGDQPVVSGSSATTTPAVAPTGLLISEIFPTPSSGSSEWVEIFNSSTASIHLGGITLEDGVGVVLELTGTIGSGSYLAFDLPSAKLNNDGDQVKLVFSGTVLDQVSYGKWNDGNSGDNAATPKTNQSVARKSMVDTNVDNIDFSVTEEVTKGTQNIIVLKEVVRTSSSSSKRIRTIPPAVIVINELVSDPGDNDVEWVEIYNAGEVSVDMSLWTIEDGSGTLVKLSGTFLPGKFMVISPIPGVLNNSGDVVILRNEKGEIADRVAYGNWDDGNRTDNAVATRDPQSLGRRSDGYDTGKDNKDFVALVPSKGASNAIGLAPDVVSVPGGAILISEIKPGADSFVELFNTTESYIRLFGWSLTVGSDEPVEVNDALIAPRGFFAIALKEKMDMSKGSVVLLDTKEHQKDKVSYRDGKAKLAYALIDNGWVWVEPTPDKQNVITIQTETVSLATVVASPVSTKPTPIKRVAPVTSMRGVVVAAPGAITKTSFYISGKQNIQIYIPNGNVKVKEGDEVVVYGKLGTSSGEPRFTVRDSKDIKVVKSGVGVVPQEVEVQNLSDADAAKLVTISGTISEKQGTTVYLDDGSGEVRISLSNLSRAKDPVSLTQGSTITVVGIVRASSSGIRIVPRSAADIVVNIPQETVVPRKTQELVSKEKLDHTRAYLFATAAAFGGLVIILILKGQILPDRVWETVRKRFKPKPKEPAL